MMIEEKSIKHDQELNLKLHLEARLCAIILNANGAKKDNNTHFEIKDFVGDNHQHDTPKTIEDLELMVRNATLAAGGKVT